MRLKWICLLPVFFFAACNDDTVAQNPGYDLSMNAGDMAMGGGNDMPMSVGDGGDMNVNMPDMAQQIDFGPPNCTCKFNGWYCGNDLPNPLTPSGCVIPNLAGNESNLLLCQGHGASWTVTSKCSNGCFTSANWADFCSPQGTISDGGTAQPTKIKNVWVIAMSHRNWSNVTDMANGATYINNTLLPMAAHASAYTSPPAGSTVTATPSAGIHTSLANRIWMLTGTNTFAGAMAGFPTLDIPPTATYSTNTSNTLINELSMAASPISWKVYAEDIAVDGMGNTSVCPMADNLNYKAYKNPFVYFQSVTNPAMMQSYCKSHIVDFGQLDKDLTANAPAQFNFVIPNVCHDMNGDPACAQSNPDAGEAQNIMAGDMWLSTYIPKITATNAYKNGGAIFIVWDQDENPAGSTSNTPIGLIALSPFAKPNYANPIDLLYTHDSLLLTLENIFDVAPLGETDVATKGNSVANFSDFFNQFP